MAIHRDNYYAKMKFAHIYIYSNIYIYIYI